jgi:hypothetical protein
MPIIEVVGIGDVELPDGMSKEQMAEALNKLPKPKFTPTPQNRGNVINTDVPTVVGERPNAINPQPVAKPTTMMDRVKALYEVPTAIVAPMVTQPLAQAYGIARSIPEAISTGKAPAELGAKYAQEASQAMQYRPTSPVSQEALGAVAETLKPLEALPPYLGNIGAIPSAARVASNVRPIVQESVMPVANRMAQALREEGQMIKGAVQPMATKVTQTVEPVVEKATNIAQALRKESPVMPGVGAAEVPEAITRYQTAQQLRVPIPLSKGEATKDFATQAFEAETAKNFPETVGKPLLEAKAAKNDAILQNFDAYVDATGKEKYGLEATGRVVDEALVKSAQKAKKDIKNAYDAAREAGETSELIDVTGIQNYLKGLEAEAINAPIITSAEVKLNSLAKEGKVSINDLEEVRKMVGRLSGNTPTNQLYGKEINKLIDSTTENVGGDLYKNARKLRADYARTFENAGYVDKLLSKKPGTTDRSVALEDVFAHSILKGSKQDVQNIGLVLKKAGPDGQKAWKELQGQTIQYIKDEVTKNSKNDIKGNPIVSPAKFKAIVRELDQDGKLDYIFGKKGAQEVRDLLETTMNVNTTVDGAANYSNSSSAIIRGLDLLGKFPVPKMLGAKTVSEMVKNQEIKKKVKESINYTPQGMANELRKGNSNE